MTTNNNTELPYQKYARENRAKLEATLALPLPVDGYSLGVDGYFSPWGDVIEGISGSYSSESDDLMIEVLEAVRDRRTFELMKEKGFIVEFALYILAGHNLIDYGGYPRGGWPAHELEDLWQPLIDKWKAYRDIAWA